MEEFQNEELQAKSLDKAERELKACENLDKIKEPIDATIYIDDQKLRYRNQALANLIVDSQVKRKKFLTEWIKDTKEGLFKKKK